MVDEETMQTSSRGEDNVLALRDREARMDSQDAFKDTALQNEMPESQENSNPLIENAVQSNSEQENMEKDIETRGQNDSRQKIRKRRIIIGCSIVAIVVLVASLVGVFAISPRVNYDNGIVSMKNGKYSAASKQFESAGNYADAGVYKACADAATVLYGSATEEEKTAAMENLRSLVNNTETMSTESKRIALCLVSDWAFSRGNYSAALAGYEALPSDFEFAGDTAYSRAAHAAICGVWTLQSVDDADEGHITYEDLNEVYQDLPIAYYADGSWECPMLIGAYGSGKGSWILDEGYSAQDGSYGYINDPDSTYQSKARVKDGVFACELSNGSVWYFARFEQ